MLGSTGAYIKKGHALYKVWLVLGCPRQAAPKGRAATVSRVSCSSRMASKDATSRRGHGRNAALGDHTLGRRKGASLCRVTMGRSGDSKMGVSRHRVKIGLFSLKKREGESRGTRTCGESKYLYGRGLRIGWGGVKRAARATAGWVSKGGWVILVGWSQSSSGRSGREPGLGFQRRPTMRLYRKAKYSKKIKNNLRVRILE